MRIPDEHEWEKRKALGVNPKITSAAEYAAARDAGVKAAKEFLRESVTNPCFDPHIISKIHEIAFKKIYPWAGEFRTSESKFMVTAVSEAKLIQSDLKSLYLQSKGWFLSSDLNRTAREIAAFNAGIQSIEPFANGTRTVARIATEHQAFLKFERPIDLERDYAVYLSAIKQTLKGNMTLLASQILEHSGLSRAAESQRVDSTIEKASNELKERDYRTYRHY